MYQRRVRFGHTRWVALLMTVGGLTGVSIVAAPPASAVICAQPPALQDQNYTVPFGHVMFQPAATGLLNGDTGAQLKVETSWGSDALNPDPSDDASLFGNATIDYGASPKKPDRTGAFTYTPDPATPFSGIDQFDYFAIDACLQDDMATAYVTVTPILADDHYLARENTTLAVAAARGVAANDLGENPTSYTLDATSAKGGLIGSASDGSFDYTPPKGFIGTDTFSYQVSDIAGDNPQPYGATVHVTVASVPGPPTSVAAKLVASGVSVSWTPPASNGSAITGYTVTASPGGKTVSVRSGPATITGLASGATYRFKVRAVNAIGAGPWSAASNAVRPRSGYWMLGSNGAVYGFGDAANLGSAADSAVAIAPKRDGSGYWTVDAAGNVSHFGTAGDHGGRPALHPAEIVSTMSATPSGNGYWLFTNRGRVFAFGDAHSFGDMRGVALNGPIIASVATPTGHGYYMVGSDGGVFSFGDARFHGSTGGIHLNKPVVGISPTPDNRGYWLVASDGGVFAFNAPFRGSMGGASLAKPVNGLVAFGNGYLMVASDGGVFDFSNQAFLGSLGGHPPAAPIIGIAAFTTG